MNESEMKEVVVQPVFQMTRVSESPYYVRFEIYPDGWTRWMSDAPNILKYHTDCVVYDIVRELSLQLADAYKQIDELKREVSDV